MQVDNSPFGLIKDAMSIGLILGCFNVIKFGIMVIGIDSVSLTSLSNAMTLAVPLVLFLLMRRYRRMPGNEVLGFSNLWSFGSLLALFGSMLSGVFEYIYYAYINPQYIATQMENAKTLLSEVTATSGEAMVSALSGSIELIGTPTAIEMVVQSIWLSFITGSLLSLVLSPIVVTLCRREEKKNQDCK